MLEVFINFICAFMLAVLGFYIIKEIIDCDEKMSLRVWIYLIINSFFIATIHYLNYSFISLILNFIINTITYKKIFNCSIEEAVIATGLLIMFLLIVDTLSLFIQILIIPINLIKTNLLIYLCSNIFVVLLAYSFIKINKVKVVLNRFFLVLSKKQLKLNMFFIILIIIATCCVLYSYIINYRFNIRFFTDTLVIISLIIIAIIFINNRKGYDKLSGEYDVLLSSVKLFEEWIEKEQFVRHEYKNQLAYLYELTTEKEVKKKIQEIINQNLDIDNSTVYTLRTLPKGGLKGLMYYKSIIAQNNKIDLTIDVSINEKGILSKLNKDQLNALSKILGIVYDNAIEAAKVSRKKKILLEIYELKRKVNIVISNTYKKSSLIENRFEKGNSSKGNGRGYGLYFFKKIINQNKWIEEKQEIIDNYYIETISIYKNTSK